MLKIKRKLNGKYSQLIIMLFVLLIASIVTVLAANIAWHYESQAVKTIKIAAGPKSSLAYQMLQGITTIAKKDYGLNIKLIQTRDGEENAELIEKGFVQLATLPAKNLKGDLPRLLANLYPDSYQLVAHQNSNIHTFTDLVGKKIGMQRVGGTEYEAFWEVASHYGMRKGDINIYTGSDKAIDWMFSSREVDAVFRVRVPGDKSISQLVHKNPVRFISIDQVEGIRIKSPTREPHQIPQGVYHGNPAMPVKDITTISESELLIASRTVDPDIVETLSTILFEDRKKLTNIAPMAAFIQQPKKDSEQLIPIHEGVRNFWERTEPPFLQKNADVIATVSSLAFAMVTLFMWRGTYKRRQVLNGYNRRLMDLAFQVRYVYCRDELKEKQTQFDDYLLDLVKDTERGQINIEDFSALQFYHEAALKAINDRRNQLEGATA